MTRLRLRVALAALAAAALLLAAAVALPPPWDMPPAVLMCWALFAAACALEM
jgi:hypothetical protein